MTEPHVVLLMPPFGEVAERSLASTTRVRVFAAWQHDGVSRYARVSLRRCWARSAQVDR